MEQSTLAVIWFALLGVLLAGYAILDGFDLGVGITHLIIPGDDRERRLTMNTIGPLWDGNEVWLVTFGGALFAAFPDAYATVFSGFYTAFMLLLVALILRAVSMEFRSKVTHAAWRRLWDSAFTLGSTLAALLFGVATGNVMRGLPLDARGNFTGSLWTLLNPYALLVGLLVVSLFAMHGTIYLHLKTEGELQKRIGDWMWKTFGVFLVLFVLTTMFTLVAVPRATTHLIARPLLWIVPVANVFAIANIPRAIHAGNAAHAFASSCAAIVALVFLLGAALFPDLVPASNAPGYSLTLFNSSSSARTLSIMLIIALIGMPMVIGYTAAVYWTFRGKVRLDDQSY
jgi:cytochrome bd ubiquinol oxidase subunit II